jgi:trans-AT polyketide synthase, acyltransferase and oxidoreductase domains
MATLATDRPAPSTAVSPPPEAIPVGRWTPGRTPPILDPDSISEAVHDLDRPLVFVRTEIGPALAEGGVATLGSEPSDGDALPIAAIVPAVRPEQLGDATFRADHRLRFAYLAGAMANGIGSVEIVSEMSRAGMLGFFGAAGLSLQRIEAAIERLQRELDPASRGRQPPEGVLENHPPAAVAPCSPFGINLIHSPGEPDHEAATVDLLLRRGIQLIEASAYLDLTLAVVRYRVAGIRRGPDGRVIAPNHIIAKVSRVEVASKFFAPPPEKMLRELVTRGDITAEQAELATQIPVAQDVTAEADSGGHTDNRPLVALVPTLLVLRDRMQSQYGYEIPLRVGAAGGISTPQSVAAAFALGAAYVLTGSINQACVESGSSDAVRKMLAEAGQADVIMAPAADMFEMGVKVQVLKRGTLFAMRAAKLYEIYRGHSSLEAIPAAERVRLEKDLFRAPLESIWDETRAFWLNRDPKQVDRAERDAKHRMALTFRWYLGLSSRWANAGEPSRQIDYQVWCGPAMGAFNEWTKGSFLERPENRRVVTVAKNLLHGAAVVTRVNILACQGIMISARVAPQDDV